LQPRCTEATGITYLIALEKISYANRCSRRSGLQARFAAISRSYSLGLQAGLNYVKPSLRLSDTDHSHSIVAGGLPEMS